MTRLPRVVVRAFGLLAAGTVALAITARPSTAQTQDLLLQLEEALGRLETEPAPAAAARAESGARREPGAEARFVPVGPLKSALVDLERRYAAQQKAFDAAARKDLPPRALERLESTRKAYEKGQGRLIAILRELLGEAPSRKTVGTAGGRALAAEQRVDPGRARSLAAEARAMLVRMREAARRQPLSGELKVRAPRVQSTMASAAAGPEAGAEDTPEAVPQALQQVAEGLAGPVQVFEWVRNTIRPEFYYGRMKGAAQTYLEGGGNDADTASLLIALLRAQGISARYVRGTVEVGIADLQAVTGAALPERALEVLARAGVPHETVTGAAGITAVRLERIWAEAYLPYDNYRGNVLDRHGKFWIPMDPAFKRLQTPSGIDMVGELDFDARAALEAYLTAPRTETPLQFVRARVEALLATERPGASYEDALNSRSFASEVLGILPGVLPFKVMGTPLVGLALSPQLEHTVRIVGETEAGSILDVTLPLSDVLGRRLTLAYVPATAADEDLVRRYGGMLATPPSLFDVKPVLRSRGVPVAAGAGQIGMAVRYRLRVEIRGPSGAETVENEVLAGNLMAIGLGGSDPAGAETSEDKAAQILSGRAWSYLDRWNHSDDELARLLHVVPVRPTASLCFVMSDIQVEYAGGDPLMPLSFAWQGIQVDADLRASAPVGVLDPENAKAFLLLSGLEGSVLEHRILEDDLGIPSISTAKALALARDSGIVLYDLTRDNVGDVLPGLPLDPSVKEEVIEATSRGLLARVPARALTYIDWTGVGYLLLDEGTGESAYQLQGGHSGSETALDPEDVPPDTRDPLEQQGEEPAPEGSEVAKIRKFHDTDLQEAFVNETLPKPLKVLVTDAEGKPIPKAPVTFLVKAGSGKLVDPVLGDSRSEVSVFSNELGEAEVSLVLGKYTSVNPVFVRLEGDEFDNQVGRDEVLVRSGNVLVDKPFYAFGNPDDRTGARLQRTSPEVNEVADNLKVSSWLMTVVAADVYGNPIANLPIRFAFSGPPGPADLPPGHSRLRPVKEGAAGLVIKSDDLSACLENGLAQQLRGECPGEAPEVVVKTYRWGGAQAFAVMGDSPWSYYRYRITSDRGGDLFEPDGDSEIYVFHFTWGPLCANPNPETCEKGNEPQHYVEQGGRRILVGQYGGIAEAYPVGAEAHVSFWATVLSEKESIVQNDDGSFSALGTNEWTVERLFDSDLTFVPRTPGTGVVPDKVSVAGEDGYYRARMRMSTTPQFNRLGFTAKHYPWLVPYLEDGHVDPSYVVAADGGGFKLRERIKDRTKPVQMAGRDFPLWGIKPVVENLHPSPVLLDGAGTVMRPSDLDARIEPAEEFGRFYQGMPVEIRRTSDGGVAATGLSSYNQGVHFPKGLGLRSEMHLAQARVAGLSEHAVVPTPSIESAPYPVPVCQLLALQTPRVMVRRIEDRANNRTCGNDGKIVFSLCQAARVTLVGEGINLQGHLEPFDATCREVDRPVPGPISDVELAPGEYQIILPLTNSADFDEARPFRLKAALSAEPETFREEIGHIRNKVENKAVLPVGHTFVKGVDLLEGHVVQQATDLKIPGRNLGLELTRTYSSASSSPDDAMGAGWSMNYTPSLVEDYDCGCVSIRTADGSGQVFQTADWNTFAPQKGYHGQLLPQGLLGYIYIDKSGTKHHFADFSGRESRACPSNFRLVAIEDPHGDRIVPTYDGRGRIVRVSEVHPENTLTPEGGVQGEVRALVFTYQFAAGFDRIVSAEIKALRLKVSYEYDGFGNLKQVTRSGQNLDEPRPAADMVWRYEYAVADGRDPSQLLAVVDPNGSRTEYRYYQSGDPFPGEDIDFRGGGFFFPFQKQEYVKEVVEFASTGTKVVSYVTAFRYDVSQLLSDSKALTTVRDARGHETVYTLNRNGSPLRIEEPMGRVTSTEWAANDVLKLSETDPLNRRTEFGYDTRGNLTLETIRTTDMGDVVTAYTYDPVYNKLTSKTDAENRLTRYTIGTKGDLETTKDAVLNETTYTYDDHGRLSSVRDPRKHTTRYEDFDSFGNARVIRDPLGNVTNREFDARGRLTKQTDSFGRETRTLYDGLDRPVEVTRVAGGDSDDEVTQTEYFPAGQPRVVTNALGIPTTYTLDGLNRVTGTSTKLPDETLTTATEYDGVGNKILERDRRGVEKKYTYDDLNRLTKVEITRGVGDEGPLGTIATYGYDLAGNKLFEINLARLRTGFTYDGLYRVVEKTLPEGPSASAGYKELYSYDKVGNRLTATDLNGKKTTFIYDDLNRLERTINALDQVTKITYQDLEGSQVNKSQEHDLTRGLRTTYRYDSLNREQERKVFLEGAGSSGQEYTTATDYDDSDHAVTVTDPRGKATRTVLNGLDRAVQTTVDPTGLGLVTKVVYDALGNRKSVTDPEDNITFYEHDGLGRLVEVTDAKEKKTTYTYDGEGLKTSETDRRSVKRTFTYDNLGRPRKTTLVPSISGVEWSHELRYEDVERKRIEIDARGKATTYGLDGLDRVKTVTDPAPFRFTATTTWDGVNKREETDRRGNTTKFDYDDLNRLTRVTDPAPFATQTVEMEYADELNRVTEKDRRGILKVTQKDPLGRVVSVTRALGTDDEAILERNGYDENGNKDLQTDAEGKKTRFIYDAANRLESRIDGYESPEAATTTFKYDKNGNPTEERDQRAADLGEPWSVRRTYDKLNRLETVRDGEDNVTTYDYDPEGNRRLVKEPLGQETTFEYDELGKLLRVEQPPVAAGTPETRYVYDPNRNRIRQTDANGHVVEITYDELNRLDKMIQKGAPEGDLTTDHDYDENGNETTLIDPKGQSVVSTYDKLNRLDTKTYAFAASDPVRPWRHTTDIDYDYDPNGNLKQVDERVASGLDPPGAPLTTLRTFDDLDRLETETTSLPDGGIKKVEYSYYRNGTRKTVTDPEGLVTSYEYDGQNRLQKATTAFSTPQAKTTQHTYYPDDLLKTVTYPNLVIATHDYDKADRLTSLSNAKSGTTLSGYVYTYDDNGNRESQVETNGLPTPTTETTTYTYDDLNRLETVTYPTDSAFPNGRLVTYGYDLVGNRLRETEKDAAQVLLADKQGVFDSLNRLTALNDLVAPANSTSFTWDKNGNQTSKTEAGATTQYRYDIRDKLVEVQPLGAPVPTARFQYCYDGKRTLKIGEGLPGDTIRQYVYDETSLLAEYTVSGTQVAKYDYGSDRLISLTRTDEPRRYFSLDGLRSVVNLTNDDGLEVASYHLDAWGNFRFPTELTHSANRFGFTGHIFDTETGLYNAKARYFDPKLGRFLTQDSFLGQIDEPPSLHRYAYGWNRPTFYIDPDGHSVRDTLNWGKDFIVAFGSDLAQNAAERAINVGKAIGTNAVNVVKETGANIHDAAVIGYEVATGEDTGIQLRSSVAQASGQAIASGDPLAHLDLTQQIGIDTAANLATFGIYGTAKEQYGALKDYSQGASIEHVEERLTNAAGGSVVNLALTAGFLKATTGSVKGPDLGLAAKTVVEGASQLPSKARAALDAGMGKLHDAIGTNNFTTLGDLRPRSPSTTILGENMMGRVIPFAERTGARALPFGATKAQWEAMSPAQRWRLNDAALRTRIGEGDSFRYIGKDPFRDPLARARFDLTRSELLRLKDRGVPYETVPAAEVQKVVGRP